jgi:hypothetical protein
MVNARDQARRKLEEQLVALVARAGRTVGSEALLAAGSSLGASPGEVVGAVWRLLGQGRLQEVEGGVVRGTR